MKKSKDTGQLIKAITMDMDKTDGVLDRLKKERSSGMETDKTERTADLTNDAITGTPGTGTPLDKDPDGSETLNDETVAQPMRINHKDVHCTASIGIVVFPTHGHDSSAMYQLADSAMYEAKARGKNIMVFASELPNSEPETP